MKPNSIFLYIEASCKHTYKGFVDANPIFEPRFEKENPYMARFVFDWKIQPNEPKSDVLKGFFFKNQLKRAIF